MIWEKIGDFVSQFRQPFSRAPVALFFGGHQFRSRLEVCLHINLEPNQTKLHCFCGYFGSRFGLTGVFLVICGMCRKMEI